MNAMNRPNGWAGNDSLELPACPICYGQGTLGRHQASMDGTRYVWYECDTCGSVLLSLGGGRWSYQEIPCSPHSPLLGRAMRAAELGELLPKAPHAQAAAIVAAQEPAEAEAPAPEPAPAPFLAREPTGLAALRASLDLKEEGLEPAAAGPEEEKRGIELPAAFVVAAVVLTVTLLAGLGLTLLVMLQPA